MPSNTLTSLMIDTFEDILDEKVTGIQKSGSSRAGKVLRVDDNGLTWVHLEGGVSETPINGSMIAKNAPGDTVLVNISDGRCSIVGNISFPASDDGLATRAMDTAIKSQKKASVVSTNVSRLAGGLLSEVRERKNLSGIVKDYSTSIEQNEKSVSIVARRLVAVSTAMTEAEAKIKINSDNIELKADKTIVNTMTGESVDLESFVNQNASKIASTVTKVEKVDSSLSDFVRLQNAENESLQNQIDGSITTWFYEGAPEPNDNDNPGISDAEEPNAPAVEWETDEMKNVHLGDLYYDTDTGYCYRWLRNQNGVYYWTRVTDVDLQVALDTANRKRTIFVVEPTTPYQIGDLWFKKNEDGETDVYICTYPRTTTDIYHDDDWEKVDSAELEAFKKTTKSEIDQTNDKIETTITQIENDKQIWSKTVQTVNGFVILKMDEDGIVTSTTIDGSKIETGSITADQINTDTLNTFFLKADFGNFNATETSVANVWNLYAQSGIVNELDVAEGNFTHELNAVLINGDLIKANTITAGKINIIGEDGIIRQINLEGLKVLEENSEEAQSINNALDGKILLAKSVTADRISVTDLTAFDATIAGIVMSSPSEIEDEDGMIIVVPGKLHSATKTEVDSPLSGFYLDSNGSMSIGNETQYIRFYDPNDPNGDPTMLEMKIGSLSLAATGDLGNAIGNMNDQIGDLSSQVSSQQTIINQTSQDVVIGFAANDANWDELRSYIRFYDGNMDLGKENSSLKTTVSNNELSFSDNGTKVAYINNQTMHISKGEVTDSLSINNWVWQQHGSGNIAFLWRD